MRHLVFETRREDLKSRIPGLFAYILFNEDGTTTLHPASDSFDGCYGKVIENINLPCGVNLCTYVSIPDEIAPTVYQWNENNAFEPDIVIEDQYNIVESKYVRQVKNRFYQETEYDEGVDYEYVEDLPEDAYKDDPLYIEVPKKDKVGEYILDCYGNYIYDYYQKVTIYNYFMKDCMLKEGGTYTYRTLITLYYKYKDILGTDHPFIMFMDKGIGKEYTDKHRLGLDNEEEYPAVPDFIYLGQVRQILTAYRYYQKLNNYYITHYLNMGQENNSLKRKSNEYKLMGGDKFTQYLEKLVEKSDRIAAEYFCHSNNRAFDLTVDYSIPLFQSHNDLGYLSCYVNEFVPGNQYYHGELVTYNGRTYICILNRYVEGGNNYEYVRCNDKFYRLTNNAYVLFDVGYPNLADIEQMSGTEGIYDHRYMDYDYVSIGGLYYKWNGAIYDVINVTEYTTGIWDDNLEANGFDTQHLVLLSEYANGENKWYSQDNTYGNMFKIFVDVQSIPVEFVHKYIRKNGIFYIWDEEQNCYIPDESFCERYTISGIADSQLTSLRVYENYVDGTNVYEEPNDGEDWLFYYKIGNTAAVRVLTDEHNNIKRTTDIPLSAGDYAMDLMAYGTYLMDITCDTVNKKLTFTYVVNGHFKAKVAQDSPFVDEDGNTIYHYEDFEFDSEDTHGVVYTETYGYDDPDIDTLYFNHTMVDSVMVSDFDLYVSGRTDLIENYMVKYGYKKFVFKTSPLVATASYFNNDFEYNFISGHYTETIENSLDYVYSPLFKKDYFVGYSYEPTVESDVQISRGNAGAFEQHIKLSEVKTFENLRNFSNQGFFTMTEA